MTQIETLMALADEYADSRVEWHMVNHVESWHSREKLSEVMSQQEADREALCTAIERALKESAE